MSLPHSKILRMKTSRDIFSKEDIQVNNMHMKRCSTLLIYYRNATSIRYHLPSVRMTTIKKSIRNKCCKVCGEKRILHTVGGNVKWCSHCGKQYGSYLKTKNRTTIYDLGILLLGIYISRKKNENTHIHTYTHIHKHMIKYYSAIKKD